MGSVYCARNVETGQAIAIKIFKTEDDPLSLPRLKRAFNAISELNHSNIVRMFSIYPDWSPPFFTMEFMEAGSLQANVRADNRMPNDSEVRTAVASLVGAIKALADVHKAGIIHRDLKPTNIFFGSDGATKLSDFGLAGMANAAFSFTRKGSVVGRAPYMSPEQIMGRRVDQRSDLYSMGVILFELLTGSPPFPSKNHWELISLQATHQAPRPSELNPSIPTALDSVVIKLLRRDPEDRYQSADEILQDIHEFLGDKPGTVQRKPSHLLECPFLDRTTELQSLTAALDQACSGAGGILLLGGEAGIGKTALVEEFRGKALLRRVNCLTGLCVRRDEVYYRPFADILRGYLKQAGDDRSELEETFAGIGRILSQLAPELARFDVDRSHDQTLVGSGLDEQNRLFEAFARFTKRIAEREPYLFLLEDFHWADELSIDLLAYLSRTIGSSRLLIITNYRSDELEEITGGNRTLKTCIASLQGSESFKGHLVLNRFDRDLTESMIRGICGDSVPGRAVVDSVYEAGAGNPFFTQELIRMLNDRSIVNKESGDWLGVPSGISELLERRFEVVHTEMEHDVLKVMAVFGRPAPCQVLLALIKIDNEFLLDLLEGLASKRILREGAGGAYEFFHPLMATLVYQKLTAEERKRLHTVIAEVLEQMPNREEWSRSLIHHAEQAGDLRKALRKAMEAGFKAGRAFAHFDAVGFLSKVVDHRVEADLSDAEILDCLDMLVNSAFKFQDFRQYDHYLEMYERLSLQAGAVEHHVKAGLCMAEGLAESGRIAEAVGKFQSLCETYSTGRQAQEIQLRYAYHLAQRMGRPAQALRILENLKDKTEGGLHFDCLLDLMRVYWKMGKLQEARKLVDTLDRSDHSATELQKSVFCNIAGVVALDMGSLQEAKNWLEKKISIDVHVGNIAGVAKGLYNLGETHHELGDWDLALEKYLSALENFKKLGNIEFIGLVKENLSSLHYEMGSLPRARVLAEEVHDLIQSQTSRDPELVARNAICRSLLARAEGKLDRARLLLQKAMRAVKENQQEGYVTPLAIPLAEMHLDAGKIKQAEELLRPCLLFETRSGRAQWVIEVNARLAECKVRGNNRETRKEMAGEADALSQLGFRYRSALISKRLAKALLDTGQSDLSQKHFLRAHRLFGVLGAKQDIKEITDSLSVQLKVPEKDLMNDIVSRLALPPFVGRESQLHQTLQLIESRLKDKKSGLVAIQGEPGTGKTRFVDELAPLLEALPSPPQILTASCPELRHRPLAPLQPIVASILRRLPESILVPGLSVIRSLFPELRSQGPTDDAPLKPADTGDSKTQALDALQQLLSHNLTPGGQVLILDDLDLADATTIDVLHSLAEETPAVTLVVVFTTTKEVPKNLALMAPPVTLAGLSPKLTSSYLEELGDKNSDWSEFAPPLHELTSGNPFFLGEVMNLAASHQWLERIGSKIQRKRSVDWPVAVQDVFHKRISGLPEGPRRVLEVASVLGREFDFDMVVKIMEISPDELWDWLEELENRQLLSPSSFDPMGRTLYRFNHSLWRDYLLQGMQPGSRRHLHERAGRALEQTGAGLFGHEGELAFHFEQAEDLEKAIHYCLQAAQIFLVFSDKDEARRLYQIVLALDPALDDVRRTLDSLA